VEGDVINAIDRIAARLAPGALETIALLLEELESQSDDMRWRLVLAHNLAIGAALCRAFALGEYFERDTAIGGWRLATRWAPGCQRSAPS
jgi:hypothetical protein